MGKVFVSLFVGGFICVSAYAAQWTDLKYEALTDSDIRQPDHLYIRLTNSKLKVGESTVVQFGMKLPRDREKFYPGVKVKEGVSKIVSFNQALNSESQQDDGYTHLKIRKIITCADEGKVVIDDLWLEFSGTEPPPISDMAGLECTENPALLSKNPRLTNEGVNESILNFFEAFKLNNVAAFREMTEEKTKIVVSNAQLDATSGTMGIYAFAGSIRDTRRTYRLTRQEFRIDEIRIGYGAETATVKASFTEYYEASRYRYTLPGEYTFKLKAGKEKAMFELIEKTIKIPQK